MGFEIDGEVIQLEHPAVPQKMKTNPDLGSNRPYIADEDCDPWELKSLCSLNVSVFNAGDLAALSSALQKAAKQNNLAEEVTKSWLWLRWKPAECLRPFRFVGAFGASSKE
jgi:hypothetical protein